eukprot:12271125-Prorocentrum_lima.AAC.1
MVHRICVLPTLPPSRMTHTSPSRMVFSSCARALRKGDNNFITCCFLHVATRKCGAVIGSPANVE